MSCNGCRVLRKGCSDNCMLRHCLQWIEGPQAQAHATVFVAKFFGRAGLMSFISSVPQDQRPALFQSLLFEAVGRTVNPVNGAVGLLWTGNWQVCQTAVETVLSGGALGPLAESINGGGCSPVGLGRHRPKRKPTNNGEDDEEEEEENNNNNDYDDEECSISPDLGLRLITAAKVKRRSVTPSEEENYSETTTFGSSSSSVDNLESNNNNNNDYNMNRSEARKVLRLFI